MVVTVVDVVVYAEVLVIFVIVTFDRKVVTLIENVSTEVVNIVVTQNWRV